MTSRVTQDLVDAAISAALIRFLDMKERCGKAQVYKSKGGVDGCTEMDEISEHEAKLYLKSASPGTKVFGEEKQGERNFPKLWILDKIDGTPNYKDGHAQWGSAVAYIENDDCLINAIAIPEAVNHPDELYIGIAGEGTFRIGLPIDGLHGADQDADLISRVVDAWREFRFHHTPGGLVERVYTTKNTTCATLQCGYDLGYKDRARKQADIIAPFDDDVFTYVPRTGSASYGLTSVACGRYGAYLIIGVDMNDILPGMLLVKEAGGVVSDLLGAPVTRNTGTVVAAGNQVIYDKLMEKIKSGNPASLPHWNKIPDYLLAKVS